MGKNNNVIKINGKSYDALTGAPIDGHGNHSVRPGATVPTVVKVTPGGPAVSTHPATNHDDHKHHAKRSTAKHAGGHQPSHSKTLRRDSVHKPAAGLKRHVKAHGHTDSLMKTPAAAIKPKSSVHHLDDTRLRHAKAIQKSASVSRFRKHAPNSAIPVTVHRPKSSQPAPHHVRKAAHPAPNKKPQTTAELLEHALRQATSHEQPPHKLPKRRRFSRKTSLSALVIASVILAGFLSYQNADTVRIKVAASKAGFAASLPGSQPAGYHLSHLNYSPGVVAAKFSSNSDQRSYDITEKASSWDSEALRDNYVSSSGQNYRTVDSAGRTLYLLGQNAATWVSGGVWYHVQTSGSLSSNQLIELAGSM